MSPFLHIPVMLKEVLSGLALRDGGVYVDGTLGGAGHAEAILDRTSPSGRLFGFDRDGVALEAAGKRLERFGDRVQLQRANFAEMGSYLAKGSCDGVLLDLGVSSPQLDEAERGFSFRQDGPLDMRMDQRQTLTAEQIVNHYEVEELARIFWEYGDERDSRRIARAIVMDRQARKFERTSQLAGLIERILPRGGQKTHPATRVFQALRIAVNEELGSLSEGLKAAVEILKPGGRLVVITFHSLEDRMVKNFGKKLALDYESPGEVDVPELRRPVKPMLKLITRKAQQPSEEEQRENVRSRSAQVRIMERND